MDRKAIKEEVLAVLWRSEARAQEKNWKEIRIVRWNDGDPVVEKRWFMTDRSTGAFRTGRATGFTMEDLAFLVKHADGIQAVVSTGAKFATITAR